LCLYGHPHHSRVPKKIKKTMNSWHQDDFFGACEYGATGPG
jgi:hypothetical protein